MYESEKLETNSQLLSIIEILKVINRLISYSIKVHGTMVCLTQIMCTYVATFCLYSIFVAEIIQ